MNDSASVASVQDFTDGIWKRNPVFVQVLGMCPVLAVTNTAVNALAMGLATAFVLLMSSTVVSAIRKIVPHQVRIVTFILIIATFVTIVDYLIAAISLPLHRALGAFIALIVVNCLILGRAEAFASQNGVGRSMLDAVGMGVGFTVGLLCLGGVRELLGAGTLFGVPIMGDRFEPWTVMMLPPGGFFTLAFWLLVFSWIKQRQTRSHANETGGEHA